MGQVANRRYYNHVAEWRVGVNSGTYTYVGEPSGLGPASWRPNDPWKVIPVPAGSVPIYQLLGNYHIMGKMVVRDYEAITQLLKTIDVVAGGGVETAMSATDRNTIGYFCIVASNTKIVNATDARSAETSSFAFTNTRILFDDWALDEPISPTSVEWMADSVTQTDT